MVKYCNSTKGTSPGNCYSGFVIVFISEEGSHKLYNRRPHKGLGKAIDAPYNRHLRRITAQRNQHIHAAGHHQTHCHQMLWLESIAKETADQLTHTVGNKAAGQSYRQG